MPIEHIALILGVGLIAGFLNTVAGGGSLLTMPVLIFLGLPSAMANGTNRVAVVIQNIVAVLGFRHKGIFDWKFGLILGIPAVIGSILGANLAISLPDAVFNKILAIVMLLVLVVTIFKPQKRWMKDEENLNRNRKIVAAIAFFFVGIYGGFIQAGVGFIIIAGLSLITGLSLVKINSLKVFVIALYLFASLAIFVWSGQVDWILGLTLAIGTSLGAWIGSYFAVNIGEKWINIILTVTVIAMSVKLFLY